MGRKGLKKTGKRGTGRPKQNRKTQEEKRIRENGNRNREKQT